MKDYKGEQILVVKRELFDKLGEFQGINTNVEKYHSTLLDPANNFFMDRAAAEDDPSHKQLIPYALLRYNGKYLNYQRGKSGGEARLHAKRSLGIGGHINPVDVREDHLGLDTYMAGVEREIEEELIIIDGYEQKIVALLNDDANEVGKVHLGVVHVFDLKSDKVTSNEDSIADLKFNTIEELQGSMRDSLESWSQICADVLGEI